MQPKLHELNARLDATFTATTHGELSQVTWDLPDLTVLSARAGPQFRLMETVALTVALIVFSVGVFVYALGLPMTIWPSL